MSVFYVFLFRALAQGQAPEPQGNLLGKEELDVWCLWAGQL